ncbi:Cys-Gln thioester bond-forming surface protein [Glycomyces sp. TRM65418]|uniref:Cys-Gln thioester bond-forming surface protein n=1 Tax=Glycomyces sp. TRM65418 TaxID=2867006 RepID=UPI001CE57CF2|nr:Cys-Gln thioester bond-forming surface protein [Glycomyces sp. TRM65418]MCC3763724.1 Cys-Gln thioester bond-forming surface protein [Glycomyces sp. TRM65418]QZD57838.1 Cys-Gln thioester bond-forming surface protein [Glycomyces sp. TRM65418]
MRLKTIRTPLAAAAALAAVFAGAPAHAEEPEPVTGDAVTTPGLELRGKLDGERFDAWANVLGLQPHGSEETLVVYCIDIETPLDFESPYAEGDWEESGVANLEQVRWVLFNGFPNVGAEELVEASGGEVNPDWTDAEVAQVAYAGTQAAVWHFTDDWALLADNPVKGGNNGEDEAVLAVYEHLTEDTGRVPDPSEFTVDLEGEESAAYEDGRFGPYTIRSNAGPVELTADGGRLETDGGDPAASLDDGERFWIVLDEGTTEITVSGTAAYDLPVGRVFLATTDESLTGDAANPVKSGESQKLILAQPRAGEVPAEWRFALDAPPSERPSEAGGAKLPSTGSSLSVAFAAGLALLVGGMTVVALGKRRKAIEH